jgi:hypothetical protein
VSSEIVPTKYHHIMVISVITAAVAVTLCALVAIAYMVGWLPARADVATPVSMASPGQQAAGTAAGVALLPGETVVTPEPAPLAAPASPAPSTPNYRRTAPSAAPVPRDPQPELTTRPEPAPRASAPAPKPPAYARADPQHNVCVNCGTVTAVVAYSDSWEVRVRFEDGTTQTFRYRSPPDLRTGQRVRLEDDRLVRDR